MWGLVRRVRARVRALLPEHWRGQAGQRVRETIERLSGYDREHLRLRERLEQAPDTAWNALNTKASQTLLNAAEEENKRIQTELARRTMEDKARQENATAERLETEARVAKITEMEARLAFVEKLQALNVMPVWGPNGEMIIVKASASTDWDEIKSQLLSASELPLPGERVTYEPSGG